MCVPAVRVETANVATPLPLSVAEPSDVVPSRNETDPVGIPVLVTVAVKVTVEPKFAGFGLAVRAVVD